MPLSVVTSVNVNVRLGAGSANFLFNNGIDLGHFGADRRPGDPSAFAPARSPSPESSVALPSDNSPCCVASLCS